MAEYASNCPISRPIRTGKKIDADFNGVLWSDDGGYVYEPLDDYLPIRNPSLGGDM
jgi:hypothetical protein